jgi:hypothetical protein
VAFKRRIRIGDERQLTGENIGRRDWEEGEKENSG